MKKHLGLAFTALFLSYFSGLSGFLTGLFLLVFRVRRDYDALDIAIFTGIAAVGMGLVVWYVDVIKPAMLRLQELERDRADSIRRLNEQAEDRSREERAVMRQHMQAQGLL